MSRTSDAPEAAPHAVDGAAPGTIPGPDGSWKLKLACVWGGELVSVLTSSILQMGFIWHIALTTNSYGGRAHLVRARRIVHAGARCDYLVDSEHQTYRARAMMNLAGTVRHTSLSMRSSSAVHPSSTSR